jgi:hypothetical protein
VLDPEVSSGMASCDQSEDAESQASMIRPFPPRSRTSPGTPPPP